jgi:glucose-1-phosphate thymidylyltransferase
MKCILLGAGYATRLYPLTRNQPKPLLPVGGVPMMERILAKVLAVKEIDAVYIVSNRRFIDNYRAWLRDLETRRPPRAPVTLIDDGSSTNDDRLGAIGDIRFAIDQAKIKDDLLVVAGDNLFSAGLGGVVRSFGKNGTTVALKDLSGSPAELISQYSVVKLDADHRIVDFEEKPPLPKGTLIAIAIYLYARKHVPCFDRYIAEGHKPDQPGYFVQWLHKQVSVYGHVLEGTWFDIGDIHSYNKANELYQDDPERA